VTPGIAKGLFAAVAVAGLLASGAGDEPASAQAARNWIEPIRVIYPGEPITDDMLVEKPAGDGATTFADRAQIVGKVARRTLLPDHPIQPSALDDRPLVVSGRTIDADYVDGSLTIKAKVVALQNGRLGDHIQARNTDSGKIIDGTVQADGGIRMSLP